MKSQDECWDDGRQKLEIWFDKRKERLWSELWVHTSADMLVQAAGLKRKVVMLQVGCSGWMKDRRW